MPEISEERLKLLVYRYLADSMTKEDSDALDAYGAEHPQVWLLIARLQDEDQLTSDLAEIHAADPKGALEEAWAFVEKRNTPFYKRPFWRAVAVIIPIAVLAWMIATSRHQHREAAIAAKNPKGLSHAAASDLGSGVHRAILTLAGGQRLDLQDQPKGDIAFQNGAKIVRSGNAISYIPTTRPDMGSQQQLPVQYNTLTTSRTSQYAITLSDGTKVWLNDSSRLYFPTFFNGAIREVALSREAYFEVAKDADHPFHILAGTLNVHVLGTNLAIRAYGDEELTTATLLKGKISVLDSRREQLLCPNEQLSVSRQNKWQLHKNINPDSALAWKEGLFFFSHADIPTVMHELSKWYNIEVEIKVPANRYYYDGEFSRQVSLPVILDYMTNEDVHFIREGNKVIVTP